MGQKLRTAKITGYFFKLTQLLLIFAEIPRIRLLGTANNSVLTA